MYFIKNFWYILEILLYIQIEKTVLMSFTLFVYNTVDYFEYCCFKRVTFSTFFSSCNCSCQERVLMFNLTIYDNTKIISKKMILLNIHIKVVKLSKLVKLQKKYIILDMDACLNTNA